MTLTHSGGRVEIDPADTETTRDATTGAYTPERVTIEGRRKIAEVSMRVTFSGDLQGVAMEGTGEGWATFDVTTGNALTAKLEMTATLDGTTQQQGPPGADVGQYGERHGVG